MTAQIAAYGRLVADPQTKTTSKGTNMTMARMAVSLPCSAAQDGQATLWLGVLAFGRQADALAKHTKGDIVSVGGTMQINQWTGQDGGTQSGYTVIADSVISARTARPGGNRQKSTGKKPPAQAATPNHDEPPFPDDIPF
ncbi:single-stranded DNA-binding protein [Salmonella enterica subsp. enterica]|nr:single-stranded DNA-binding protein [Salmonella enterica subsp. enterica]EFP1520236.1 single-stranded DNA-binding protein [Salmonella enterica]EJC4645621.1 single-stranded DNA-binding protein [Salmonella enterica]EJI0208936.1 single-stranded DNA-binding protein [Salmonella enterica subsp. enterica]EKQ9923806.1 single-stranded DNA-binding protein [Salmonella enterica subsp. enterica serovar Panama]